MERIEEASSLIWRPEMIRVLLIFLCLLAVNQTSADHNITKVKVGRKYCNAYRTDRCSDDKHGTLLCCSLDDALKVNGSMRITILSRVSLYHHHTISDRSSVMLKGEGSTVMEITCNSSSKSAGVTFKFIKRLEIHNITFCGCGGGRRPAAITVYSSTNIFMSGIKVHNSTGLALSIYKCYGIISILKSAFRYNEVPSHSSLLQHAESAGGGVHINVVNSTTNVSITRCRFTDNNIQVHGQSSDSPSLFAKCYGGGLFVEVAEGVNDVNVTVTHCSFSRNQANNGGGAAITLRDSITNVSIIMKHCTFEHNIAHLSKISSGGGLIVSSLTKWSSSVAVKIIKCRFSSNLAHFGGGVSMFANSVPVPVLSLAHESCHQNSVQLRNCTFTHNSASSGAAIDVSRQFVDPYIRKPSTLHPIRITNCKFTGNIIHSERNSHRDILLESIGVGIVFVGQIDVTFESAHFESNMGSAIAATSTDISFKERTIFKNNTSINGGAINLQQFAHIVLFNGSEILFERNRATNWGGALYSEMTDDHMLFSAASCPIRYYNRNVSLHHWNSSLTFINNSAGSSGHSIYLSSLNPCKVAFNISLKEFSEFLSLLNFSTSWNSAVATAPSNFSVDHNITIIPGQIGSFNLNLTDDLNNTVNVGVFRAYIFNSSIRIPHNGNFLSHRHFRLLGQPRASTELLLQTTQKPTLNIRLNVTLLPCPPDFKLHKESCVCDRKFYGVIECNDNGNYSIYLRPGVWVGCDHDGCITGTCHWFCKKAIHGNTTIALPLDRNALSKVNHNSLCQDHSHGILCSECEEGYTVYYNDYFHCMPSKNCSLIRGWFQYIAFEMIPITILVVVIIATRFNITSGYAQGFILYSHILVSLSITGGGNFYLSRKYYRLYRYTFKILYNFVDVRFRFPELSFCLLKNGNAIQMVFLRYLYVAYAFLLVIVIVAFINCFKGRYHCFNRLVRFTTAKNAAVHGLAALFILSYTNCVDTSLLVLQPACLTKDGSIVSCHSGLDARTLYFRGAHLYFAIPAVISFALFLIPSLMLLLYPLVTKLFVRYRVDPAVSKIAQFVIDLFMYPRLKNFYDLFYSPFRDECRCFAGLYLVYKLLVLLPFYLPSFIMESFSMEIILIAMLVVHAVVQPYRSPSHNKVDALLLGNLALINGFTCCSIAVLYVHPVHWDPLVAQAVQLVFSSVPMAIVLLYFSGRVLKTCWRYLHPQDQAEEQRPLLESSSHYNRRVSSDSYERACSNHAVLS